MTAVAPASAAAQLPDTTSEVRALAESGVGLTRIHGETTGLVDVRLGLTLSPGLTVAGVAYLLPERVTVGRVGFQDVEMSLGYGGVSVEITLPGGPGSSTLRAGLLLGAGNADIRDAATSLRLDSDNFVVVEPALGLLHPLLGRASGRVDLSYRWMTGVDDLRGVEASELRFLTLRVGLRVAPL